MAKLEFHVRSRKYDGNVVVASVTNPVMADTPEEAIEAIRNTEGVIGHNAEGSPIMGQPYADYDEHFVEHTVQERG